jgi:hypothetical protein
MTGQLGEVMQEPIHTYVYHNRTVEIDGAAWRGDAGTY